MPAQLRIASHDRNATLVSEGVRCGMEFCGAVLGDLISLGGIQYVSLLEGYRKEKTGDYRLHRHAAWRNRRYKPPKTRTPDGPASLTMGIMAPSHNPGRVVYSPKSHGSAYPPGSG